VSPDQLVAETIVTLLDLDTGEVAGDTPLAGLPGWDSVNALRVLVYLEREAGAPLDFERFGSATTVGDLVALVAGREEVAR
jgi:acyl carrier protein